MTIEDTLGGIVDEQEQLADAIHVRALLQEARNSVVNVNVGIQKIVDTGNFNTLPADLKIILNQGWVATKALQAALTTGDLDTVLTWSK